MTTATPNPGSIYQTQDGWRGAIAVIEADGTSRRRYVRGATEAEAREKLATWATPTPALVPPRPQDDVVGVPKPAPRSTEWRPVMARVPAGPGPIIVDGLTQHQLDAETPAERTHRLTHIPDGSRPTQAPRGPDGRHLPPCTPPFDPAFNAATATRAQRAARYQSRGAFDEPGMDRVIQGMSDQALNAVLEGVRTGRRTL